MMNVELNKNDKKELDNFKLHKIKEYRREAEKRF